jgi:secreted trypsin-like serine protease
VALSAPALPPDAEEEGGSPTKIVGGEPVPNGKYRYIAAVLKKDRGSGAYQQQWCGGTLIDRNSVLTAAHCFFGNLKNRPGLFRVALGRTDLTSDRGVIRNVKRIFIHPRYNGSSRDAAVLKLSGPVRHNPKINLAKVTSRNRLEKPGSSAVVAGWGNTNQKSFTHPDCIPDPLSGPSPRRMREARVPISSDSYAAYVYNTFLPSHGYNCGRYVPKTMIAADKNGKGTCQGDSGGPLIKIVNRNGKKVHIQIGIVSFGAGCAYDGYPGVYAEVNSKQIAPFIKSAASK